MASTKTKIVATVGPASRSPDVLAQLVREGVDVVRFNMSHGRREDHERTLDGLRDVSRDVGLPIATIADLCGPKIRIGMIDSAKAHLAEGARCTIVRNLERGTAEKFSTNTPHVIDDVQAGHRVLIDDGQIRLRVIGKTTDALTCVCEVGGDLSDHKGVNVPDTRLSLPSVTDKDLADLEWAVAHGFDYIALSFVRSADDIKGLRDILSAKGADTPIIAKIETPQAIEDLFAIIDSADAVLVARGDLGVEMDVWRIPMLQKRIVRRCRHVGKPVIIATQMLQSMVDHPTPTRAEVSDVANAVLDGADAVMLSAESAVGRYPVAAVAMLSRVAREAEGSRSDTDTLRFDLFDETLRVGHEIDRAAAAVARSAVLVGHDLGAKLLAVWCRTGRTARWISKYLAPQTLVALCPDEILCRRMALSHGIEPMLVSADFVEGSAPWAAILERIVRAHSLNPDDVLVVVGDPTQPERMSTLSIHVVRQDKG